MNHFATSNPFVSQFKVLPTQENGKLAHQRLAVKDIFHIANRPTSAGNPAWLATHSIPKITATAVTKLQGESAVIVGKTITDELAYSLDGQNCHYGSPVNTRFPNQIPGGSSSGSAIAVANGLADIGLGSDTGGSIRVPASYNGLYGLRPTWGRISTDGMLPLAHSFDTVGWMTQTLDLMRQVGEVLLGDDAQDIELKRFVTLDALQSTSSQQTQIERLVQFLPLADHACSAAQTELLMQISTCFSQLQGAQIWQNLGDWTEQAMPELDTNIHQRLNLCKQYDDEIVAHASDVQTRLVEWIETLLGHESVLVIPTTPGAAPLREASASSLVEYRKSLLGLTAIAGLCGLPQLHIPCCEVDGRPAGISFIGPKNSDVALLSLAQTCFGKR